MAGLSGTVDIPKVGRLPRAAVIIGVGGVIVLILYERKKSSSAAAAGAGTGTAGADQYPPDGTTGNTADPYSTDPSTGQTYGDEAAGYGAAAGGLGDLYGTGYGGGGYGGGSGSGSYPWDGTYGNPNDPYSMDPATGLTYGDEGSYGTGSSSGPPFSTNAAWSQYVLNYFSEGSYSDLSGRTDAIGLYLAGQDVDAQQVTYIHDATAIGGKPPVAGTGNYPPSIRQAGGQGGTVTVPDVVGTDVEQATQILKAAGLVVHGPAGVKGVTHVVTKQSPSAGSHVQRGTTETLTVKDEGGAGTGQSTVPDVTGKELVTAQQDMSRAGFRSTAHGPAFTAGKGKTRVVTAQSAKAGSKWKTGTNVVLTYKVS